jgi:dihydrolipoamide dehydrogenase
MSELQDLVVIGGGAGGFTAAMRAAQLGGKVTLIEKAYHGGNCMNRCCIPLTFLATAAELLERTRAAGQFGLRVGKPGIDLDTLHERKDLIIEGLRLGTEQQLLDHGISPVEGKGSLASPNTVVVDGEDIRARSIVIATGSIPAQLAIDGADLPGVIGTEEAIELREVPARLAILGGRPWDLELAQYFRALGAEVTLVVEGSRLLPDMDAGLAQRLAKLLHDGGISIRRRTKVETIRQEADGTLAVCLTEGQGEVLADGVLAARRLPDTTGLGLRALGVKTDHGAILVDGQMRTSVPGIYAIGDATAGPMWSHKASAEGIVAAENAMGLASRMNYDLLPHCAYTWPQLAWVGLTEEEAEARGLAFVVGKVPLAVNPQAVLLGATAGEIKVIATRKYGKILGVHMLAPGAVELISVAALAMQAEATVGELMRLIPRHPSIGEALVDAAMAVEERSLHLPKW